MLVAIITKCSCLKENFFQTIFSFQIEKRKKKNRKQNGREMAVTNNYLLIFFWCNDFHCMYGFIFDMFGRVNFTI